ncbi:glycosyltransferase, partial [Candidatus Woesearchaeota archaeon]|nr:glycosyltransferase [Candidatus Woesearchaeota archaeon]
MKNPIELSIIIPCYNEEASLPKTISSLINILNKQAFTYELILVNNGSKDKTGSIIDFYKHKGWPIIRVDVKVNQGYGNGIIQGSKYVKGRFLAFMCADAEVPLEDVVKIYDILRKNNRKTIVKVYRYFRDEPIRKIFSRGYNLLINILFGRISWDINAAPKILYSEDYFSLNPVVKDSFFDAELLIKAKRNGFKIIEYNTKSIKREYGKSSVKLF